MSEWRLRSVLLGGAAAVVLGWTCPRPGQVAERVTDPQRWLRQDGVDAVAGQLAGFVGWLALAWLTAGVALIAAARLPGVTGRLFDQVAARALPVGVRRALTVALGLTLTAGAGANGASAGSATTGPAGTGRPAVMTAPIPPDLLSPWPPEETTALWSPPTQRPPLRPAPTDAPRVGPAETAQLHPVGSTMGRARHRAEDRRADGLRATTDPISRGAGELAPPVAPGTGRPTIDPAHHQAVGPGSDAGSWPALDGRSALSSIAAWGHRADESPEAVDWPLADGVRAVTVGPGDSLWLIAARRIGPDATDAEIAAAWPQWYAANRAGIGADPGLLRVGQRLAPP